MSQLSLCFEHNLLIDHVTCGQLVSHVKQQLRKSQDEITVEPRLIVDVRLLDSSTVECDRLEYSSRRKSATDSRRSAEDDHDIYSPWMRRRVHSPHQEGIEQISEDTGSAKESYDQPRVESRETTAVSSNPACFGLLAPGMWCQIVTPR